MTIIANGFEESLTGYHRTGILTPKIFSSNNSYLDFKGVGFDSFLFEAGSNSFTLSPSKWIESTNAIKEKLIPEKLSPRQTSMVYASEANLLNMALFGKTASEWRAENPDAKGNIRDDATLEQLVFSTVFYLRKQQEGVIPVAIIGPGGHAGDLARGVAQAVEGQHFWHRSPR